MAAALVVAAAALVVAVVSALVVALVAALESCQTPADGRVGCEGE